MAVVVGAVPMQEMRWLHDYLWQRAREMTGLDMPIQITREPAGVRVPPDILRDLAAQAAAMNLQTPPLQDVTVLEEEQHSVPDP